jgi:hypothetical protein
MSTLADLKRVTLRHLQLPADTGVLAASDVAEAVNAARRTVMQECGGLPPEPFSMDLTAGLADYALDRVTPLGRVTGVSVRQGAGGYPQTLRFLPASQAPYSEGTGVPRAWTLRIIAERAGGFGWDDITAVGTMGGPVIRLFPTPDTSVAGGLVIHAANGAGDLVEDTDTSALPLEVDSAACWLAASELAIDLSDDPSIAQKAGPLAATAERKTREARKALRNLYGGRSAIVPSVGFGSCAYDDLAYDWMVYDAPEADTVLPNRKRLIFTPETGASYATVDISRQPADPARFETALAFSGDLGFLSPPTFTTDGRAVTVSLSNGITFPAGDAVYLWYDAAS